jgi:hypothetical protein
MQQIASGMPLIETHAGRARRFALVGVLAAAAAVLVTGLGVSAVRTPAPAAAPASVRMSVLTTAWTDVGQGTRRLHLEAVIVNPGSASVSMPDAQSFAVRAADGRTWGLIEAPVYGVAPSATMRPGEQRDVDLYADLPAGLPALTLTMSGAGQTESIPLS